MTDPIRLAQPVRIGRRGLALLILAFFDIVYGLALVTAPRPLISLYAWMAEIVPLGTWAASWWLVAIVCVAYSMQLYDTPAFVSAVSIKVGWGLLSLWGWIFGEVDRGWVTSLYSLVIAAGVFLIAGGIPAPHKRAPGGRRHWWTRSSE